MKQAFYLVSFLAGMIPGLYGQSIFLVSTPGEIKLIGMENYLFISHHCFLLYSPDASNFKMVIDMYNLRDKSYAPLPGQEAQYNTNVLEDTNNLVFEGMVPEDKMRPGKAVKDNYTFSFTGTVTFRNITYTTQLVCSYGAKMIRNVSTLSLNINMEILKMDVPMYIPAIKDVIDNLKVEVIDGTVNIVQR